MSIVTVHSVANESLIQFYLLEDKRLRLISEIDFNNTEKLLSILKDKYSAYTPDASSDDTSSSVSIYDASVEEVGEWLQKNDLELYVDIFKEKKICGESLLALMWILRDKINAFHNSEDTNGMSILRKELTMSLGDALKFMKLLVSLPS